MYRYHSGARRNWGPRDHVVVWAPNGRSVMWVIVAVTLAFSGEPQLAVVPGPEYPTEAACVKATHVRGNFDSDHAENSKLGFSFCVRKDSVQIGPRPSDEPEKK